MGSRVLEWSDAYMKESASYEPKGGSPTRILRTGRQRDRETDESLSGTEARRQFPLGDFPVDRFSLGKGYQRPYETKY